LSLRPADDSIIEDSLKDSQILQSLCIS
jgi:hypothetical protein